MESGRPTLQAVARRAILPCCMKSWSASPRSVLTIGAAALATFAFAAPSLGQEMNPRDDSSLTPPLSWLAATGPQLACGVQPTRFSGGGSSSAVFTCWVAGAPASDTTFSVQAMRIVDEAENTRPLGPICDQGTLTDGSGVCSGTITDPSGAPLVGGVLIGATLQPSGTEVGPVPISPSRAS